jgi:hypothetical protein
MDRVKTSDWLVGIGGLVLLISVFLEWFHVKGLGGITGFSVKVGVSGWDASKLTILIFLFALACMAVVVLRVLQVDLSVIPVPLSLIVMGLAGISLLIIILRIFIHQSGLGVSYGIFVSLVAGAVLLAGGILMQREEY